jgi:RNA polymerase sigma-70 factor (ECF subfamily)
MIQAGPSDADLAAAARAGSAHAFGRLVDRHQAAVRAFLRRLCGNAGEADDLAQETFLTAWTRLATLRPDASVRAWLCGIAWRKHLSWRRSWARGARRDREWLETRLGGETPTAADRAVVLKVMAELPVDQRAAVALCVAGDFSHAEAAEALGCPLGTVKSHVARGRARLVQALGVDDDRG